MKKMLLTLIAAFSASALFAGNTCTWTGAAGDGNWATAGNWEDNVAPVSGNGDRVVLSNAGSSAVISNGLGAISIDGLTIAAGSQAFKLVGDPIELRSKSSTLASTAIYDATTVGEIEIATPLVLEPSGMHYFRLASGGALHLSGDISGTGGFDYQSTTTAWQSRSWRETDRLKLSGNNTFEGNVWLRNYCTDLATTNALGKAGKTIYLVNHYAKYRFSAEGHYAYNFTVSDGEDFLYFYANAKVDSLTFYQSANHTSLYGEGEVTVEFLHGLYINDNLATTASSRLLDVSFPNKASVHVYEKFRCGSLYVGDRDSVREGYDYGRLHIHSATATYETMNLSQGSIVLYHAGFLHETEVPVYNWRRADGATCFYLNGNDQTIDHLDTANVGERIADTGRFFQSDTPATLTLKATADGSANVAFKDALSVVYDPVGGYRQEITNRTITMTGDLTVMKGTFALVGTTTMKNANLVSITSGGTFEVASSTAKSLENVKKITVANGSLLKLATAADPFAGKTEIQLAAGAQLDPGSARTLTSALIRYDGAVVANNRYQATGGGDPTAEQVPWIAGDVVLTVDGKNAYWKQATDGTWGDSTKWAPAQPAADNVIMLTAEGASYAVNIDADAGTYATLNAAHEAGGTAMLNVNAALAFAPPSTALTTSPTVTFGAGASVSINAGGTWSWTPVDPGTESAWDPKTHVSFTDGATMTVNGGVYTNTAPFRGAFVLGSSEASATSTLSVVSGVFDFDTAHTTTAHVQLDPGGRLAVSGDGVATFRGSNQSIGLVGNGGTVDVSGNGRLELAGGDGRWFGGDTTFRDNAKLVVNERRISGGHPRIYATPTASGDTMEILFKDHANIGATVGETVSDYFYRFTLGNGIAGTTTKLTLAGDGVYNLGNQVEVGFAAGRGELRQSSGSSWIASARGLAIGTCDTDATTATPIDCSGLLEFSGGVMTVNAGSWSEYNRFNGFTVGNGYYVKAGREGRFEGRAVISGGVVTNDGYRSVIGIGVGQAKGEYVQTGGTHIKAGDGCDILVGFSGGEGLFALSNGTFRALKTIDTWVGGCPTNELQCNLPYCPDRHDAKGVLDVAGGTFQSDYGRLFVGVDGSGELALGETGQLQVKELVLSNGVDRATGTETKLRLTFGPTGIGKATVTSQLRIDPGTKLVVDTTAYTGAGRMFTVLEAANRVGDFRPEDVTVIRDPAAGQNVRVNWSGNRLRIGVADGMMIIVR